MAFTDKIKRDFARHKQKAIVLAILAVVMLGFIAKAYFDMAPRTAVADPTATGSPNAAAPAPRPAETEMSIEQTKLLWKTLREKRGLGTDAAFAFESSYFNPNPNRKIAAPDKVDATDLQPKHIVVNEKEAEANRRMNAVKAASRNLAVRSTVVGTARPVAVINDQTIAGSDRILGVGDRINGFKIIAIRAREVEFEKDGITLVVEMARNPGTK